MGILFLTRRLWNFSQQEQEQCLLDVWERARRRVDLLSLQIILDYRECCKASGLTYLRHRDWFWSNRDNPEFWAEWRRRFPSSETKRTAKSSEWARTQPGQHANPYLA
jgi:hypothetical protein